MALVGEAIATITADGAGVQAEVAPAEKPVAPVAPVAVEVAPAPAPAPAEVESAVTVSYKEPAATSGDRVEKLSPIRRVIADRMMHSLQTTAQLTSVVEIDVTRVAQRRAQLQTQGQAVSFLSLFVRAALDAISKHAIINSTIDPTGTELTIHEHVALGIAVDSAKGLMVPVIKQADMLDAPELTALIEDVADRVRSGGITASELSGGTFTITNTGSRGALFDTPILNSPQSAILGTGAITRRVVPLDGDDLLIGVRSFVHFSLTYDHRVIDGADAARYLSAVKLVLEQ